MKKFFKILLTVLLHLVIAAGIIFIGFVLNAICDDIVTGWSIDEPVLAYIAASAIVVYWCKKGAKRLEA